MQTMAIGFLPKTLDFDLVRWNILRLLEDQIYTTPKRGAFKPFIWRWFSIAQAKRRGLTLTENCEELTVSVEELTVN